MQIKHNEKENNKATKITRKKIEANKNKKDQNKNDTLPNPPVKKKN